MLNINQKIIFDAIMNLKNRVNLGNFAEKLYHDRTQTKYRTPQRNEAKNFINQLLSVLFPHFSEQNYNSADELEAELEGLEDELEMLDMGVHSSVLSRFPVLFVHSCCLVHSFASSRLVFYPSSWCVWSFLRFNALLLLICRWTGSRFMSVFTYKT